MVVEVDGEVGGGVIAEVVARKVARDITRVEGSGPYSRMVAGLGVGGGMLVL